MPGSEELVFRASSYSNGGGGCVEPAPHSRGVTVRDSKDPEEPRLEFTHNQWATFLHEVISGLTCTNGAVSISTEEIALVYRGELKHTCWHLHAVNSDVVLHFTAEERDAFFAGAHDGEFDFTGSSALAAAS